MQQHGLAGLLGFGERLKGDPLTLMAGLLISMGRQEATKPGRPCNPGPLLLSLLTTNEKPHSLALHISNSPVAAPTRLKCRAISRSTSVKRPQGSDPGAANPWRFPSGQDFGGIGRK